VSALEELADRGTLETGPARPRQSAWRRPPLSAHGVKTRLLFAALAALVVVAVGSAGAASADQGHQTKYATITVTDVDAEPVTDQAMASVGRTARPDAGRRGGDDRFGQHGSGHRRGPRSARHRHTDCDDQRAVPRRALGPQVDRRRRRVARSYLHVHRHWYDRQTVWPPATRWTSRRRFRTTRATTAARARARQRRHCVCAVRA